MSRTMNAEYGNNRLLIISRPHLYILVQNVRGSHT